MTKTSLDALDILYRIVKNSEIIAGSARINGGLYKSQRPINSDKEDVVVNALPMNRNQVQEGLLNLNIYVPNQELTINGVTDLSQPNYTRIAALSAMISTLLNDVWEASADYTFNIQQDTLFADDNNQHYQNFRIEFYSPNF